MFYVNMVDPTHDEMANVLRAMACADEFYELDREEAIYWFANDYHGGQDTNLYSALSTSKFSPGPISNGDEAREELCYQELVDTYT